MGDETPNGGFRSTRADSNAETAVSFADLSGGCVLTTVLTTTLTTVTDFHDATYRPNWSSKAWSWRPPAPGSVGVRGWSPLSSTHSAANSRL